MQQEITARFQEIYGGLPTILTRAPGRIEFIGNHVDYNGGAVLGVAIDRDLWVALSPRADGVRRFFSGQGGGVITLGAEDAPVRQGGEQSWLNYPLGVLAGMAGSGLGVPGGFDYLVMSDLPPGAGLSSSAALELASALAFLAATGEEVDRGRLVGICRKAENEFVGVPCGILDQSVSAFGRKDHLVLIDCQGPVIELVSLPAGAHFWVFNTHVKHALMDGLYADRHRECMEAAALLGVKWLASAPPIAIEVAREQLGPVRHRRARHIVEEVARVRLAVGALRSGDLAGTGRLLNDSHHSSQHLFENSTPELDFLVEKLTARPHVFGARLTGGGFGGAVMALTGPSFLAAEAREVAESYARRFGATPGLLHLRTGDGADRRV